MKTRLYCFALMVAVLAAFTSFGQDFSNKGKDFWVGYGYHVRYGGGNGQDMVLYFATESVTNVRVEIPALGYVQNYNNIAANTIFTTNPLPKTGSQDARLDREGILDRGIHITSDKPIVAYAHIYNQSVSGATLLFPTATLGKEYYSINFDQRSNEGASNCFFYAVAVDTGITTIEVIPSASTQTMVAGNTYTFNLTQGQIFNALGTLSGNTGSDLTGTRIRSISSTGSGCKRIAVFSGSGKICITCNGSFGSADNYMVQAFPKNAWGKYYLTVPTQNMERNFYRIAVSDPTTVVRFNGTPLTGLVGNFYYQTGPNNTPNVIEADKPIMVAQYITTAGQCGNNVIGQNGDPEMIYLSPVEQNIDRVILNSTNNFQISQHFINIVIPNRGTALSSFTIDGAPPSTPFVTHPGNSNYSYLTQGVGAGQHILRSDSGFNAIAYGYGNAESYGYNAGANIKDLYQFVSVQNQFATVNFPATCKGAPFYFSMTFPYQPTQIQWQFSGLFPDVTITNPVYDSTWFVNGRQLYRYKLTTPYSINTPGTYPIKVIAQNPTPDGCSGEQEITYDLQVFDRPTADFNFTTTGCVSDSVRFTDNANTGGRQVIKYSWDFDDGNTSQIRNPSHLYQTPRAYNVKYSVITDVGCLSDTSIKTVTISQPPVAKFGVSAPYCVGRTITFTDSSTTTSSTIVRWYWNFGDGSLQVVATTNAPQTHIYNNTGNYTVSLQVETATGCRSTVFSQPVVINANPVAAFNFGNACLPAGTMQFTNTSTISDGTQSQFTYSWNFGDGNTSTAQNPTHNYAGAGPFNVTLTVTSNAGCSDDSVRSVNTVFVQPDAQFSMSSPEVCPGGAITFTDQSTATGSSVTSWQWNFGDGNTSTVQNPVHNFANPGTYTVTLRIISAAGCTSDIEEKTVTVLPRPLASFIEASPFCERSGNVFTSNSVPNAGSITQYKWFVNGVEQLSVGNSLNYSPTAPGVYAIRLLITTDRGCTDDTTRNITAHARPDVAFSSPAFCVPPGVVTFPNNTTISDGTISSLTYLWNFGDGNTSTQVSPTHTYTSLSPVTISLTATSNQGCTDTKTGSPGYMFGQPAGAFNVSSAEVCLGTQINFTDATVAVNNAVNNNPITGWQWNFGDGNTSTVQNPSHTYANSGNYTVTLTTTTQYGCTSTTATRSIIVNSLPNANFNVSAPNCVTRDITFTDASVPNVGTITKWNWNMGDGTTYAKTTNAPFTHTYSATGSYNVTLQVETNKGCISTVFPRTVIVSPLPVPAFGTPENCLSDPFSQFTDSSTIADGSESQFTYLWNFGDPNATTSNPNTSTAKNPQHRYTQARTYTVSLTVTSNNGCSATVVKPFTINGDIPQAAFTVQGGTEHCSDDNVTIVNQSTVDFGSVTKLEVYWDYSNDPTNKTVDNSPQQGGNYTNRYPVFFAPATRSFTIMVVAYSGDNCISSLPQTITVKARPQLDFDDIASVCADVPAFRITQARMTNGLGGNGVYSGPGTTASGLFTPSIAGKGTHTIRYTFTASNGCPAFIEKIITVFEVPIANAGPDRFVLEGGTVTLVGSATGPNVSYVWTPIRHLNNPAIAKPAASPADDITYTLTVTTADGCKDDDDVFVKVLKAPLVPNTFSPNGDNIHDKWEIKYLESYPGCTVQIYNRYGQLVFESKGYSRPWDGTFKGKDVPAGTYYYIIDPKNGRKQITGFVDIIR